MRYSQEWLGCLVSVKMACKILWLSDVESLAKTYLNGLKSVVLIKTVFLIIFCFAPTGLSHHYRIQHSRDRVRGYEEMKRGKYMLRIYMAAESLNNIAILS